MESLPYPQQFHTNMRYPASAKEKGTQGRVTVQFVVDKDGSIKEPKLLRSVDKDMDAEDISANRVVADIQNRMRVNIIVQFSNFPFGVSIQTV